MAIELGTNVDHGRVGRTGVEPDVQGVWYFHVIGSIRTENVGRVQIPPRLNTVLLNALGHFFHQLNAAWVQLLGVFVHKQ
ncbi:hypothetical protein D3C81_1361550 [compost metagenome]